MEETARGHSTDESGIADRPIKLPPINRFYHDAFRDLRLTFNQKCRDLIMQIFGHEALMDKENIANLNFCDTSNTVFYRLSHIHINKKHLALRKVCNPFKWAEFLIVAPLELLKWGAIHSRRLYGNTPEEELSIKKVLVVILLHIHLLVALCLALPVNFITGIARYFLAPVRYIIRPGIQTARNHPYFFIMIVLITVGIASAFLTGGLSLPALLNNLFLTCTLETKLAIVGTLSTLLGAVLTKSFNTCHDLLKRTLELRALKKQANQRSLSLLNLLEEENQRTGLNSALRHYGKHFRMILIAGGDTSAKNMTHDAIINQFVSKLSSKEKEDICQSPLIVKFYNESVYLFQRDPDHTNRSQVAYIKPDTAAAAGEPYPLFSTLIRRYPPILERARHLRNESLINRYRHPEHPPFTISSKDIFVKLYTDFGISLKSKKAGSTARIAETFHAIDIARVQLKPVEQQSFWWDSMVFFTGTESIFYPRIQETPALAKKENSLSVGLGGS